MRTLLAALALLAATPASPAQLDDGYHIATLAGLWRLDRTTGDLTFLAPGFVSPLYGHIYNDQWILPDSLGGHISKVDINTGVVTLITSGGLIGQPATVALDVANDLYYVSDLLNSHVLVVDSTGAQSVFADNDSGLLSATSGLSFGPDGQLYVGSFGNGNLVVVDPAGNESLVSAGGGLLQQIGGITADGSGNVFIADWTTNEIVRVRVEDGTTVVHCDDPLLEGPNDIKLTKDGKLLTTTFYNSSLFEIDVSGNATRIDTVPQLGWWQGVSVASDFPKSTGRMDKYGAGTPGTGGFVPDLRGVFSPTIGGAFGLEFRNVNGGAPGFLMVGLAPANVPAWGGTLLVSLAPPKWLIKLTHPGTGPGGSSFVLPASLPNDLGLVGFSVYMQDLVLDAGSPTGEKFVLSNGLQMTIGM